MTDVTSIQEHPDFQKAWTEIQRDAVEALRQAVAPLKPFTEMAELSVCAVEIAKQLAKSMAIEAGVPEQPWESLPVQLRDKCLRIAERALVMRDADIRVQAAAGAARDFALWMDGPYGGKGSAPTHEEQAARAIALYEERLAHPLVRDLGKCFVCGGLTRFQEESDVYECETCSRTYRRRR